MHACTRMYVIRNIAYKHPSPFMQPIINLLNIIIHCSSTCLG